jgi:hypothetical protein
MGQKEMAIMGKNWVMIYGPKTERILAGVLTVASGGWLVSRARRPKVGTSPNGTSRTSGNIRLKSAKWAKAEIDQVTVTNRDFMSQTSSNLANNLFASSCDNRRPIIAFGTCHLRSSSWPSVNVPSSDPARAARRRA